MIEKIRAFVEKHWDMVSYLFFGVLTTVVNYLVYLPLYNLLGISAAVSNMIAWAAAVAFAYVTNKPFVFKSHDWSMQTVLPELGKFVGCRAASGGLETALVFLTVDVCGWDGNVWKLIISVAVVILNYVSSKLLVFRK
ncbi:MAG TPA: teichoic acid glycosylation protein [Clostridiales bacterium]|nr:teichoic acid glycosylation protein [Clostridiales bacterium]